MTEIWHVNIPLPRQLKLYLKLVFTIGARTYAFSLLQYNETAVCVCGGGGGIPPSFLLLLPSVGQVSGVESFLIRKLCPERSIGWRENWPGQNFEKTERSPLWHCRMEKWKFTPAWRKLCIPLKKKRNGRCQAGMVNLWQLPRLPGFNQPAGRLDKKPIWVNSLVFFLCLWLCCCCCRS